MIVVVPPHDACLSCYHSMIHVQVLHVIDQRLMLRCGIVLLGAIMGTINMGTIGVRLYQHFMTARTSYVIGLPHNVFFLTWYHTCYHVLPNVIWCYLSMIHSLHVIDLCSPLRCDTVLYGDHKGIVDMGTNIWGPLIWGPSIYVDINITIYVDKINSVW